MNKAKSNLKYTAILLKFCICFY